MSRVKRVVRFHCGEEVPNVGDEVTLVEWYDHGYDPAAHVGISGPHLQRGYTLVPEARTNQRGRVIESGWMGNTNDVNEHARGRFVIKAMTPHDAAYVDTDYDHTYFGATLEEVPGVSGLAPVARAASRLEARRSAVAEAEAALTEAVRRALAEGARAVDVATTLGVSRARVYQIRDGRR